MDIRQSLEPILAKSPADLTENDKAVLQARQSYLTEEELVTFGLVEPTEVVASTDVSEAPKTRKVKKTS